jgi:GNAT superfamily N-acetyltransferase
LRFHPMRVLTYDELTPEMDLDRALIHLSAFGGVYPSRTVDLERARLKALADYAGLFAVEGGRVLAQVFVQRIPYAFHDGPGTISGIAAVGTRPDRARAGIARRLLTEVHRREREAGIEFAALWTNRSWGAHGLYERLGYRDVYSSPWVAHGPAGRQWRGARAKGVRPGRRTDLSAIDDFHDRQCEGRLGFYRRPNGFSRVMYRLGHLDPGRNLLVARRGPRMLGYAHIDQNRWRVTCGELVGSSAAARRSLVHEVGRAAGGRHFVFQHTLLSESPEIFRGPGYRSVPTGWYAMMGLDLSRPWTTSEAIHQFATNDPKFVCLAGDRF